MKLRILLPARIIYIKIFLISQFFISLSVLNRNLTNNIRKVTLKVRFTQLLSLTILNIVNTLKRQCPLIKLRKTLYINPGYCKCRSNYLESFGFCRNLWLYRWLLFICFVWRFFEKPVIISASCYFFPLKIEMFHSLYIFQLI